MRFFKYLLRKLYHLIAFLTLFIIFSNNVNAAEINTKIGDTNYYTPPYATFGDVTNGHVTRYEATLSHNIYYAPSNLVTNGANTDGMAVVVTQESVFMQGYTYAVSILVGFGDANIYPKVTSQRVCVAHNLSQAISNYNNNSNCTTVMAGYTWDNVSPFTTYDGTQVYLGMVTYVFKSPTIAKSFIGVVNSSSYRAGYQTIGGIYVQQLADNSTSLTSQDMQNIINNSGLATASSVNQVQQSITRVQQEISNIDNTLNDSSVDSSDDTINNLKSKIPTNSVISDLLLLPVRFLQNFVNALGSSCSNFSLGSLYGTELFMPCINIESYLGSAIWTTIDLIISGLFVYYLRKKFIQIYENLTNLKNGGNEVD